MRKIALGLRELEGTVDLILTSPYLRAAQTAQILGRVFKLKKGQVIETEHLASMGFPDQLIQLVNEGHPEAGGIMLVGHEPYLSRLISVLVSGDSNLSLNFKKGGVCRLSLDQLQYGRCATLDWLLFPSQLAEIGN
jgi:phosphohistidine phosphatase